MVPMQSGPLLEKMRKAYMREWTKYIRRYRRFEHHSIKEVVLQKLLPSDWDELASIDEVKHEPFDLASSPELYTPSRNKPHQRGVLKGFITNDAVLWPAVGAVRTADGRLITESFFDASSLEFCIQKGYLKRFPLTEDNGVVATLGHPYRNYYHRYADSIPRVHALRHPAVQQFGEVRLYLDDRFSGSERAIIRHLIPSNVRLVETDAPVRVRASTYIHLPYLSIDRTNFSKWFSASAGFCPIEYLQRFQQAAYDVFDVDPDPVHRKLYVTRRNAKVRRLTNEDEVANYLSTRGFEVVALETLPQPEQIKRFAEAQVVVAQHGAGLTNLLYARDTSVLEIMSDRDKLIFYRLISESLGFPHAQLHMGGGNKNDDVRLPLNHLAEALDELEADFLRVNS